jgi:hypothetical protein
VNTSVNGVLNIAGELVFATIIFTLVSHPETAKVIKAIGDAFVGSLRAASGQKS